MAESGGTGDVVGLRAAGGPPGDDARSAGAPAALIEFDRVGFIYRSLLGRRVRAVEEFSLTIGESEVFGLAGPNGAGKSTLISLLLGYVEPTEGTVRVAGQQPRAFVERHGIGYLSELIAVPPRWTIEEALTRYGILAGVRQDELKERMNAVIGLLGLDEHRGKRVKQLSKGNLQRLGLAQALLREERVIILDEPTHGLDPVWTQKFRDIVQALRRPGRAIFIASHNLDELQRLADRVAIIDHGRLQRVVEPRGMTSPRASATPWLLTVHGDASAVTAVFPDAVARGASEWEIRRDLTALNEGLRDLLGRGVLVSNLQPAHSVLEQHFREAVGE